MSRYCPPLIFTPGSTKMIREAKLWNDDRHHNGSTKRPSGAQLDANLNLNFLQLVWQHTVGVVGYIIWVLFTNYSSFWWWKNFENRLGFDKVIAISLWSTFLENSVYMFYIRLLFFTCAIVLSSNIVLAHSIFLYVTGQSGPHWR